MKIILGILFLSLSNTNMQFGTKKLTWRFYNTTAALLIISQVELIDK